MKLVLNNIGIISKQFHDDVLPEQYSRAGAERSPQPGTSVHICYGVTLSTRCAAFDPGCKVKAWSKK